MSDNNQQIPSVELIDEDSIFVLGDLCRSCGVDAEFIETLIEHGILEPKGQRGRYPCFSASSLRRTRVTLHLNRDLGVNIAGAALALDLLDRIDELESQLHSSRGNRV